MARRKPPVAQTLLPVDRPVPPRVLEPLPDWFDPPEAEIARARPVVRVTSDLLENIVPRLRGGDFVLPPFQRGRVWSRAQKVSLLDSIMRGLPIGVIVCCSPQVGETYRPIGDAPASTSLYANVVLDGQQRLTTLLEAASGLIPVRWSERHGWGERGYVDMVTALRGPGENVGMYAAVREAHGQDAAQYQVLRDRVALDLVAGPGEVLGPFAGHRRVRAEKHPQLVRLVEAQVDVVDDLRPPRKDPAPFLRAELEDREPPFNVVPLVHRAALRWTLAEMMAEAPEPAREEALRAAETFLYCADTFALVAPFARAVVPKWWWIGPARRGLVRTLGFEAGQTHPWLADLAVNMLIGMDNAVALACHELLFAKHQRFHKHSPPVPLLLRQAERPVVIGAGEPSRRPPRGIRAARARTAAGPRRRRRRPRRPLVARVAGAMVLSNVLAPLVYNDLQLEPDGMREGTRIAEARAKFGRTRLTDGLRRLVLVAAER